MFMPREVHVSRPRPPVPPRPNKLVLDEAVAKSKANYTKTAADGVVVKSVNFKHANGQHVHETANHRRPTVLLITNGRTLVQEDARKSAPPPPPVSPPRIKHSNWYQVEEESGRPVKYSSCQITLEGSCASSEATQRQRSRARAISMSSLQGLPPLPKSLSGINLVDGVKVTPAPADAHRPVHQLRIPSTPPPPPPTSEPKKTARKMTTLDTQLAILRKEMFSLRELDLSLLSQLWSLNESIQEFRQMQEAFSPPSPSSDVEDDVIYSNLSALPEHQAYPLSSSSSRSSTMDLGDV